MAAGSLDKSVRVWSVPAGDLIGRLEGADGHTDSVYSVAFSPDSDSLVSGSLDKTIKMWQLMPEPRSMIGGQTGRGGRCTRTFEGHKDFVLSVALTPDGDWVLSGSKDRGVQFWNPRTGDCQLMLQGHKNSGKPSLALRSPVQELISSSHLRSPQSARRAFRHWQRGYARPYLEIHAI